MDQRPRPPAIGTVVGGSPALLRAALSCAVVGACVATGIAATHAQEASSADAARSAPEYRISPYAWLVGIDGTARLRPELPEIDVDVSARDLLSSLDGGFLVLGEARFGRAFVLTDLAFLRIDEDGETASPDISRAELSLRAVILTVAGGYRVVDTGDAAVDVLAGGRAWQLSTDFTVESGSLAGTRAGRDRTIIDPIVGTRASMDLGADFGLTGYVDIGGAGSSDFTWQAYGGVSYRFTDRITGIAAYRALDIDYDQSGFSLDVTLHGPLVGVTFAF